MKILMFSDIHCDASTAGKSRFDEVDEFMTGVGARCAMGDIDVAVFLGDAYDPGTLDDPRWAAAVMRWAITINADTRLGSVWIAGNHDAVDMVQDGRPVTTLSALGALTEIMNQGGTRLSICAAELPRFHLIAGVGFLLLPYVSAAVQRVAGYSKVIDACFEAATEYRESFPTSPLIVCGHLSFDGMHPGSEAEMPRGRDQMFPTERVKALSPTFVANGHYHKREIIKRDGLQIQIVGAPLKFTFGEKDDGARGYLVVEV